MTATFKLPNRERFTRVSRVIKVFVESRLFMVDAVNQAEDDDSPPPYSEYLCLTSGFWFLQQSYESYWHKSPKWDVMHVHA